MPTLDEEQPSEEPEKAAFSFLPTEAQGQLEFTLASLVRTYGTERVRETLENITLQSEQNPL